MVISIQTLCSESRRSTFRSQKSHKFNWEWTKKIFPVRQHKFHEHKHTLQHARTHARTGAHTKRSLIIMTGVAISKDILIINPQHNMYGWLRQQYGINKVHLLHNLTCNLSARPPKWHRCLSLLGFFWPRKPPEGNHWPPAQEAITCCSLTACRVLQFHHLTGGWWWTERTPGFQFLILFSSTVDDFFSQRRGSLV